VLWTWIVATDVKASSVLLTAMNPASVADSVEMPFATVLPGVASSGDAASRQITVATCYYWQWLVLCRDCWRPKSWLELEM